MKKRKVKKNAQTIFILLLIYTIITGALFMASDYLHNKEYVQYNVQNNQ